MKVSHKGRRIKGRVGENEVAGLLDGARIPGRVLTARRVPLSGAVEGYKGEVMMGEACQRHGYLDHSRERNEICGHCGEEISKPGGFVRGTEEKIEVKRLAQGFKKIDSWLQDNFAVVYRADRGEWVITLRLSDYADLSK